MYAKKNHLWGFFCSGLFIFSPPQTNCIGNGNKILCKYVYMLELYFSMYHVDLMLFEYWFIQRTGFPTTLVRTFILK